MNLPSLILGLVLSTLVGAFFHLIVGGGFVRLLLYLVLGWSGFWAGHFLGQLFNLDFLSIGSLHLGPAVVLSLTVLVIGYFLNHEVQRSTNKR